MMTPNLRRIYVEKNPWLGTLRRIYVESTSKKTQGWGIYVESTSNLRRIYVESTSNLRRNLVFGYGKNLGRVFWGQKKPLREWGHALPGFGQVPVSNPGLKPGASRVRRPRASPLGNLTTVGHLAKVSPDPSHHFQTQQTQRLHFLTPFSTTEKQVF